MKHQHNWNRNIPRSDGFYEGFACEDCSAFITPDNIIVETVEANIIDLIMLVVIIISGAVLIYG